MSDTILKVQNIQKRFGATITAKNITLSIDKGEFFTFLGPSGSGKSTLLRMIAGLETPDAGDIFIMNANVASVPPWKRDLGMMFQNYAVFPHMSVMENVSYGLRMRGVGKRQARARAQEMLDLVGLGARANAVVTRMSGGEQQRIALARALAPSPKMLLLDEPLSALDEKIRRQMQEQLKEIQRELGTTFVYVTHDQEEALTMSDRVAVFNGGVCVQVDEPHALHQKPKTRFVAQFFRGCNIVSGTIEDSALPDKPQRLKIGDALVPLPEAGWVRGRREVNVALRAENLLIGEEARTTPIQWDGRIDSVVYRGANTDYEVDVDGVGRLVVTTISRHEHEAGGVVKIGVGADDVVLLAD